MNAYIEILSEHVTGKNELSNFDLRSIGEFTRENIANWLKKRNSVFLVWMYACGDTDVPWAMEEAKLLWTTKWQEREASKERTTAYDVI
jgi:hypothetical protein